MEDILQQPIDSIETLHGGNINETYIITVSNKRYVIKLNSVVAFPGMFTAEASGLRSLKDTNTFLVPTVIKTGQLYDTSFILMDYISPGEKKKTFWNKFGMNLAKLHQHTHDEFGYVTSNYIGSLPQYNSFHSDGIEFYIYQRLEPQLQLASKNNFIFKRTDSLFKNLKDIIPSEKASLVHGDLWNGNYLAAKNGIPCIIDPAVSYMYRETDIAMMHLFGGFHPEVFNIYNEAFPLSENWKERMDIWQLYYLLAHLNIFGNSYYTAVNTIIQKYV